MTPLTLMGIHHQLKQLSPGATTLRFRVRNVETLQDYGIFYAYQLGFSAMRLDYFSTELTLWDESAKWALLSSQQEVACLSNISFAHFSSLLADSYRRKNDPCHFGEG
jgi:hypothetical protein